jgi:hypothetical protein
MAGKDAMAFFILSLAAEEISFNTQWRCKYAENEWFLGGFICNSKRAQLPLE